MSDCTFDSSPSASEATLAFEPLHEGQGYSKAVLETLGVTGILSAEDVMRRYKDGSAKIENVVEWAEIKGVCIILANPHAEDNRDYWCCYPEKRKAYIVAPENDVLSKPLLFKDSRYFESILFDGKYITSPASLPLQTPLYSKRLLLSPVTGSLGIRGQTEHCWKVEHAFLQSADHLIKMPGLSDMP